MRGTWSGVSTTIEAGSGRDSTGRGGLLYALEEVVRVSAGGAGFTDRESVVTIDGFVGQNHTDSPPCFDVELVGSELGVGHGNIEIPVFVRGVGFTGATKGQQDQPDDRHGDSHVLHNVSFEVVGVSLS
jgi:hypothetical protein